MGKEWLSGSGRGGRRYVLEAYANLVNDGCLNLIEKYPIRGSPGNPYYLTHKGSTFNLRWLRHLYFVNLLQRHLADAIRVKPDFTALDLGCGYGVFTYLLKSEYPESKHIMIEFPEHLILCYYFLLCTFPDAKLLVVLTPSDVEAFDPATVDNYDFVLIPPDCYQKLEGLKDVPPRRVPTLLKRGARRPSESRLSVLERIGESKRAKNVTSFQVARWNELIKDQTGHAAMLDDEEYVEGIREVIQRESVRRQNQIMDDGESPVT